MEISVLSDLLANNGLGGYFNGRKYSPKYFEQFLPFKLSPTLQYQTILGSYGSPVMADVVAYSASSPLKTRRVLDKLTGDIPKISMKKKLSESQLNTYMQLKNLSINNKEELLSFVYGDVDHTVEGCRARMEWLALRMLSYGAITLNKTNNNGMVTESEIDFLVPAANKIGASVNWNAAANTTKPITDIGTAQDLMIALGMPAKYMLMSTTSYRHLRTSTEAINFVFGRVLKDGSKFPTQSEINQELALNGYPEIIIVDSRTMAETDAHVQSSLTPWYEGVVTFIPELECGSMMYAMSAEEMFPVKQCTYGKHGNILVSKFSETDPVTEYTVGQINAFPSWETAGDSILMYTLDTTWSI